MRVFVLSALLFLSSAPAFAGPMLDAIDRKQWSAAFSHAQGDPLLATYISWRKYSDMSNDAGFGELANFISTNPNWPRIDAIKIRAEKALFQEGSSSAASEWIAKHPPVSGYGKLVQARLQGDNAALIKEAWVNGDFDSHDEEQIFSNYGHLLNANDHRARIERLLKDDRATIAERLIGKVGSDDAALFRARIALIRRDHNVDALVDAVPASRRTDDGFIADRALWRDAKGYGDGAVELLNAMRPQSPYAQKLWPLRAKYARELLESRRYADALRVLNNSGNLTGAMQADALWLRGWVALEFQNQPQLAYDTFKQLFNAVQFPVSKSRAAYWASRASQKLGNAPESQSWLAKAAAYPSVFYGQLAQAQLYPEKPLSLGGSPRVSDEAIRAIESNAVFRVAKRLTDLDEPYLADPLIRHLAESGSLDQSAALVKACQKYGMTYAQIRAAKLALQRNVLMASEGWPMVKISGSAELETPLALAIARQESEFNRTAVSPADARGLMQLLPSTAKHVAKDLGVGFDASRLFDPEYNIRLGTHFLAGLVNRFSGSYILAIAGYNAGPSRPMQWSDRFGRPGRDLHSTLNWLEMIPFAETRNYVQRVMENTMMYRALQQPNRPLTIAQDLVR